MQHCKTHQKKEVLFSPLSIDTKLFDNTDSVMTQILFFRNGYHNLNNNFQIITATTEYNLSSKIFDEPLL